MLQKKPAYMPISQEAEQFQKIAESISKMEVKNLINPPQAAVYDFSELKELFETIIRFYTDLLEIDLSTIPPAHYSPINNTANEIHQALKQILGFNHQSTNSPRDGVRDMATRLRNAWYNAYTASIPHLAYARVSSSSAFATLRRLEDASASLTKELSNEANRFKEAVSSTEKTWATKQVEIDQSLAAVRAAAEMKATEAHAKAFDEEAKQNHTAARKWLIATCFCVGLSVIVTCLLFGQDIKWLAASNSQVTPAFAANNQPALDISVKNQSAPVTQEFLQKTIARLVVVTLLYFGVIWCGRNYAACRHNSVVNRHRRNAMQTFLAFRAATTDDATKNFVLSQAVACAFAPQQSGYLKNENLPEPAAPPLDIKKITGGTD